jgi:hypothetical protein
MLGFHSAEFDDLKTHQQPSAKRNVQQATVSPVYTSPALSLVSADGPSALATSIAGHLRLASAAEPLRCTPFSSGEWNVCVPAEAVRRRAIWLVADGALAATEMRWSDWTMRTLVAAYACQANGALRVSLLLPALPNGDESESESESPGDAEPSLASMLNLKLLARLLQTAGVGQVAVVEPSRPQLLGCFPMPITAVPINDLLAKAVQTEGWAVEAQRLLILCQDFECIKGAAELRRVFGADAEGKEAELAVFDALADSLIASTDSENSNASENNAILFSRSLIFYTTHITAATCHAFSAAFRNIAATTASSTARSTRSQSICVVSPHFQAAALRTLLLMHGSLIRKVFVGGQGGGAIHASEALDEAVVRVDVGERLAQYVADLENM